MKIEPREEAQARLQEAEGVSFFSSIFFKYLLFFNFVALFPLAAISYLYFTGLYNLADGVAARYGGRLPSDIEMLAEHYLLQGILVTSTFALLIIATSIALSWYCSSPIKTLLHYLEKIRRGEKPPRLLRRGNDELGRLTQALHTTVETFKTVRERDRELSKTKSDFLSITSHQLRTPLTGLRWALEQYMSGKIPQEKKRLIMKKEYETVEYMIHLVDQLLNASRIEEGRFGYSFEKKPLIPIMKQIIEAHALLADARDVKIRFETPSSPIPDAVFDEKGVGIVLTNLIANAIGYSKQGDTVAVSIGLSEEEGMIEIVVKDTGIGISPEDAGKLFTKFFRAENARRMQPNGSGLGLYVAKSIVDRHGGTISLQSAKNEGTVFTFTLPTREEDIPVKEVEATTFFDTIATLPDKQPVR
jgi:signal transduction histidine kinase